MKIKIQSNNMELDRAGSGYIRRRLIYALSANKIDIVNVKVWLAELSRGRLDSLKRCRIEVKLTNGNFVISENAEADLYLAIHRSVDRAGWKLSRSIGRAHARAVNRFGIGAPWYNRIFGVGTPFST